ncbi:MAG: DUF695 domain-containing protein [Chitinophagaceae bacterium]|nr:MAG: DUF695 domain-containing protein [Chitinophagaceae bacterium]
MNSNNATYTGFEFDVEGYPAIAIINKDLNDKSVQAGYPQAVFIELVPDTYNEVGHPDQAEYDYLVEAEKKMIEYLESQTATVHVGHVTMFRMLQVIFYTKESEKVEGFLNYFLSTVEREHHLEIEADPEWEGVSAFYELL